MYLQFYINDNGDKVYTTKKESPLGLATQSAHPGIMSQCFISQWFFFLMPIVGFTKKKCILVVLLNFI
uniref:Nucleolar protein 10 n=1 Tax=Rhizophora mucronata TaxID=61149 RepID=A0A2P2IS51_RHIMU